MLRYSILLLVTIVLFGCDLSGLKKKDKIVEKEERTIPDGERKNYKDGKLISTVTYMDGVKNGPAKNFYPDGKVHSEFYYENDVKDGEFKWYYENGQLYKHVYYWKGEKDSIETTYFENGKIRSIARWRQGMPGTGLIEYTNTGKKRTFPELQFTEIDEIKLNDQFTVVVSLKGNRNKVDYYQDELMYGEYLPSFYQPMRDAKKGKVKMNFEVPPGTYYMQDITIVARMKTRYGNDYIVQKKYHLAVENRGS